jgi:hypothetical protein
MHIWIIKEKWKEKKKKIGSHKLFAPAGFEPESSWSLLPE